MDCFLETQWPLINLKETQHREVIKLLEQEILSDHVKAIKHLQTCSVVPAFLLVPRQEEYFSFEIVCCFFFFPDEEIRLTDFPVFFFNLRMGHLSSARLTAYFVTRETRRLDPRKFQTISYYFPTCSTIIQLK